MYRNYFLKLFFDFEISPGSGMSGEIFLSIAFYKYLIILLQFFVKYCYVYHSNDQQVAFFVIILKKGFDIISLRKFVTKKADVRYMYGNTLTITHVFSYTNIYYAPTGAINAEFQIFSFVLG